MTLQPLFEELDLRKTTAKWYYLMHWLRRVLTVFLIGVYFGRDSVCIQLAVWAYLNLVYCAYIMGTRPYLTSYYNRMDSFNECCVVVINCFVFCFTPFVADVDSRYLVGWFVTAIFAFAALVNIMSLVY